MAHIMVLPLPFNYQIPKSQLVNVTLAGLPLLKLQKKKKTNSRQTCSPLKNDFPTTTLLQNVCFEYLVICASTLIRCNSSSLLHFLMHCQSLLLFTLLDDMFQMYYKLNTFCEYNVNNERPI